MKVAINQTENQQEINDLLDQFVEKSGKSTIETNVVISKFFVNFQAEIPSSACFFCVSLAL